MHRRLEQAVAALAVALGDVHRGVGVADQLVGVGGRLAARRPRCRGWRGRRAPCCSSAQRRGERVEDALGGVGRLLGADDVLEQDGELVAAEARGGVGRRGCSSPRRSATSRSTLVAGGVAEAVVDRLEVVEVEEEDRDAAAARGGARATAWRTRSTNSARLARPVTGSWKAWWASCSSNALRSLTSRPLSTMPRTCSSSSRLVCRISNWRSVAVAVAQRALEHLGRAPAYAAPSASRCSRRLCSPGCSRRVEAACRRPPRACSRGRARSTGSGRRSCRRRRAP